MEELSYNIDLKPPTEILHAEYKTKSPYSLFLTF